VSCGHAHHSGERHLRQALAISVAFLVLEAVGGILANSLALLSDAGHMVVDVSALALASVAAAHARRPRDPEHTFGYRRLELLAALGNGVLLAVVAGAILREAFLRLDEPPEVRTGLMLAVACAGLVANLLGLWLLRSDRRSDLNLRAAFYHVAGDAVGSLGAIAAALVMRWTGWQRADAIASILISVMILWGAVRLVRESVHYLMEGAPREIAVGDVEHCVRCTTGVVGVHDLHLWRIGTGMDILTAHVVVDDLAEWRSVQREIRDCLRERFGLVHVTLQMEGRDDLTHDAHRLGVCDEPGD